MIRSGIASWSPAPTPSPKWGERRPVHAVTADVQQRSHLWSRLVELYADFETYQGWTEREIPVVILQPR